MSDGVVRVDPMAWPQQPGSGRGRSHGTSTGTAFDRWFRYPAGFASDYVALLLDRLDLEPGSVVLDCFMGSGVTGTAAMSRSLNFAGIEAHPLIAELATLKLQAMSDPAVIRASSRRAVELATTTRVSAKALARETELVQRSFAADILKRLVQLRTVIQRSEDDSARVFLKWALLGTLRDVAGVKVGWPYQRPGVARAARHNDVFKRFQARAEMMALDITGRAQSDTSTSISVGDARDAGAWANLPVAQGCITSPPYLNNFDYADATRLELYFWGEVRSWSQMCAEVRVDMLTATTQQSSKGAKTEALQALDDDYAAIGEEIAAVTESVEGAKAARGRRSKEYDQVIPAYFAGIGEVLRNLQANLDADATALWLIGDSAPYGVYIDTPALIGRMAEHVGFEFKEDVLLRRRGTRWTRPNAPDLSERMIVLHKI